jgi:murein DD-endopeptidase MepM/ murein hydrolase activator NlpD
MRPAAGARITNRFATPGGYASSADRHGRAGHHTGIDFAARTGTPVRATVKGTVVISERNNTMGNWVGIYDNRTNATVTYWHMNTRAVAVGQRVRVGQRIGTIGSTGNSTGPHTHVQVNRGRGFVYAGHINPGPWVSRFPRPFARRRAR